MTAQKFFTSGKVPSVTAQKFFTSGKVPSVTAQKFFTSGKVPSVTAQKFFTSEARSHLTTSLPTSLLFNLREGCGRCDRFHIPAVKIGKSLGWDLEPPPQNPFPPENSKNRQESPETSADRVHHRNLPGDFFRGAGQRNWTFFSGQPQDDCSITSRVKRRGQRRSWALWKVQESQVSPPGCSP